MAHQVDPRVFRIKSTKDWRSRGFYEGKFPSYLEEDHGIRDFINDKMKDFGIGRVEIERFPGKIKVIISTVRPGLVIGRGGERIKQLKRELEKKIFQLRKKKKKTGAQITPQELSKKDKTLLKVEVKEIKKPWFSASFVAQWMASQIEKRTPYRRVLKRALGKIMDQKEAEGARVQVAGRLNGIMISRTEWLSEGNLPRQTLRANIDYAEEEAYCTYGVIGIKVWIYKGEEFE